MTIRQQTMLEAYMYLIDHPSVCENFINNQNTDISLHLNQGYWPKFPDQLKMLCVFEDKKTGKIRDGETVMNLLYLGANRRFNGEMRLLERTLDNIIEYNS